MRFDILHTPFYRNKAAYIVGRVVSQSGVQPFIIAVLHHEDKGLYLDALLTKSSQMRVIFGFARAYFMVETHAPSALVRFLNQSGWWAVRGSNSTRRSRPGSAPSGDRCTVEPTRR